MARVLIVEDSATQAEKLQVIMESDGHDTVIAANADEAISELSSGAFDIMVSDIVMPGKSGYELCAQVKAHPQWRDLPVILLTTRKDPMDIFRGLECGADNFFTKPYDPQRLLERIRHILHNRQLRAQGKLRLGVEVSMFGKTFVIGSEREQILDLLISTFEDIVQANIELETTRDQLNLAKAKLDEYVQLLEGRVRSSEGRYGAVFDGIAEGVMLLGDGMEINSSNPAAQRMFGYRGADLDGMNLRALVSKPERLEESLTQPEGRSGSTRKAKDNQLAVRVRGRRNDDSEFPLSLSLSEVQVEGEKFMVALTRDLTAEHESEQQLRQAQKIEAMGQLTGGVAHDFNNLLTVISGNAEELSDRLAHDASLFDIANMIAAAAQRGADLTSRLLAFARRQTLEPKQVNIGQLVLGMENLLCRTLGAQIDIRFTLGDDLWHALVDPAQLESSLLNLALNARDAMGDGGGHLTIEARNQTISGGDRHPGDELAPGDYVVIAVSDTGEGIAPGILNRVLEPFFTTKPAGKGTGMGLPMVYGFVKQSEGHLAIYSELGRGTTIRMYLPRSCAPEGTQSVPATQIPRGTETILLVEDEAMVRQYAEQQLKSLGYTVLTAEDGPSGLACFRENPGIDLLFTDVIMPGGMGGKQLADEVAKLRPGMRILFTSGYAEDAIVHNGRLDPGVRLLGKPYRRAQLAQAIRGALDA